MHGSNIDEYFKIVQAQEKLYGTRTVVFMEKGTFMELYGIDNEIEKIGDISQICKLLDIFLSYTNKSISGNNRENPYMAGIPIMTTSKYYKILLEKDYTIVEYKQTDKKSDGSFNREVVNVITNGCNIEDENSSSNTLCIYGEYIEDRISKKQLLIIGLTMINVNTGEVKVYETFDKIDSEGLT